MVTPKEEPTSAAGSTEPGNSGTSVKTVPESDLIALKQSADNRVAEANKKVEEAETKLATATTTLESERAGHKPVEEKAAQVDALTEEVKALKISSALTKEEHDKLLTQNLDAAKARLVRDFKIPQEKVAPMTLDQAQLILDTVPIPSPVSSIANLGMGGGGGGSDENLKPVDRVRRALDAETK